MLMEAKKETILLRSGYLKISNSSLGVFDNFLVSFGVLALIDLKPSTDP